MIFFRYKKKLVLIILILCLLGGIYLLDWNNIQERSQDIRKYRDYLAFWNAIWSFNPVVFNKDKTPEKIKDQFTINDTLVGLHSKEDKMLKPTAHSPVKPIQSEKLFDFFGDEYAVDDNIRQTTCPSSIQEKIFQTDFAEMFLPSVPVLQWVKHYSEQEYKRLSHYSGAHGWGSISAEVLNESLSILNTSANHLMFDDWEKRKTKSQCILCAVVGNAGILNGSKKGQEIDQNDYVFSFLFMFFGDQETRYIFLPDHDRDYILMRAASLHIPILKGKERSSKPPSYFGSDVTVEKFKMYHPDFIRYIRNRFLHSRSLNGRHKHMYRPSTGAVILLAALHTCDEVNSYGFMTPDFSKYSDHYYDKTPRWVRFFANHDLRMELNL